MAGVARERERETKGGAWVEVAVSEELEVLEVLTREKVLGFRDPVKYYCGAYTGTRNGFKAATEIV